MQQRRLRLGDILDDYCPRERRITNHAVVAMIEDEVKQTRCTTCDADHEYKQAKVPSSRRRKPGDAPLSETPRRIAGAAFACGRGGSGATVRRRRSPFTRRIVRGESRYHRDVGRRTRSARICSTTTAPFIVLSFARHSHDRKASPRSARRRISRCDSQAGDSTRIETANVSAVGSLPVSRTAVRWTARAIWRAAARRRPGCRARSTPGEPVGKLTGSARGTTGGRRQPRPAARRRAGPQAGTLSSASVSPGGSSTPTWSRRKSHSLSSTCIAAPPCAPHAHRRSRSFHDRFRRQARTHRRRRQQAFTCVGHRSGNVPTRRAARVTYQGRFEEHVRELAQTLEQPALVLPCDVTSDSDIDAVFGRIDQEFGGLDFLVHGAAFASRDELSGAVRQHQPRGFPAGTGRLRPTRSLRSRVAPRRSCRSEAVAPS